MGISINDLFGQPAEPKKAPSINDLFVEQDERNRRQESARVRTLVNGVQHSPEQASEALTLSRRTGVPADVALRNLDPLRQMASVEEFDADTFVRENPKTSRWLQADPINPAIARDDFESLTGTERIFGRWRMPSFDDVVAGLAGGPTAGGRIFQQVQRGTLQAAAGAIPETIQLSRLYANTTAEERRRPEVKAQIDALRARMPQLPEAENIIEESARFALEGFAPSIGYIAGQAGVGALAGTSAAAAAIPLQAAALGPAGVAAAPITLGAGAAVGAALGAFNAARELSKASAAMTLENVRDANGKPLSDTTIDVASEVFGVAGGALELGGYSLIGRQAVRGVARVSADAIAERAAKQATANLLTQASTRRVATEVAKTVGTSVAVETGEEVAAEFALIGTEAIARIAGNVQGGEFGPVEDVTERLLTTAYQTALGAVWLGGIGGAGVGIAGIQRINQAKQDGAVIEALAEQAGMSKLRQRDPAKYEELVRLQTPESLERVGIDAEKLTMLLQEQSVPLAQFAEVAGITEQDVTEALARGGDVYIPTPNLLARLVGTPVFDAMKMDLRIRPDGLTQREADEQAKTLEADQKAVEAEMQEIVKNGTTDASGQRVIDDITAQITAATAQAPKGQRFTPENIEATARGIAAFFITTAERTGQDAFALYQSRNYRIVGRETAEPLYNALVEAQKLEKSGKNPERLAELRGTIAALRGTLPAAEVRRMEQAVFHGTPYTIKGEVRITRADGTIEFHEMGGRLPAEVEAEIQAGTAQATDLPGGRFRLDKIGTGEGAQAYGWGLYFAENQGVAEGYRTTLSKPRLFVNGVEQTGLNAERRDIVKDIALNGYDAVLERNQRTREQFVVEFGEGEPLVKSIDRTLRIIQEFEGKEVRAEDTGSLYRVDIPDEAVARMLDWDKPLSEQAPEVLAALRSIAEQFPEIAEQMQSFEMGSSTGSSVYRALTRALTRPEASPSWTSVSLNTDERAWGSQKAASLALLAAGIPGIKYLDAGSRNARPQYRGDTAYLAAAQNMRDSGMDADATLMALQGAYADANVRELTAARDEVFDIQPPQTRNLVVFDENLVTITHRNGEPVTAQERTDFLAQESTGRARAGGERASANGYFYKGGQFLPSTSLPPGKFRIGGKIVKAKKEEVARGVYETQPTPYSRSLYSLAGVGAGVVVNDTGVMEIAAKPVRDNNGNLISRDTEFRPGVAGVTAAESVTLGDIIDAWNSGQRWFSVVPYDVEAGQEVAPTELPSRTDFLAQTPSLPETLEVDGVSRPTRNSTGQPIHPTEEGVRNFWRWFGDSKVVDAEGRPLVVYHGTREMFDAFDLERIGEAHGRSEGQGFYFTTDRGIAEGYGEDGVVMSLYLRIANPIAYDARGFTQRQIEQVLLKAAEREAKRTDSDVRDGVLANFGDTYSQPIKAVAKQAAALVAADETALDQMGGIIGSGMSPADLNPAVVDVTGVDGVMSQGFSNMGGSGGTIWVTFTPEQIKSADANSGEFGPTANILRQGAGRPNAFIMQGVSQKTIALMNGADLSSLLHEFSHDWLEILGDLSQGPNATEQTQADYAAILKYLGVESRDQIGVPEQEKFARSFERWLATAEAPSRGLARAFVRFKSWMQRIYRMAQEMLVPVDPAIADVFARMLATDEELAQVSGQIGAEPMFTDAESAGKTTQEMADYQRKVELRTAEETGALLSALLREKSEEAKKIRREREQEIRAEVAEEVAALPVYRMTRFLQTGELPSGTVLAGADKLNREGLEAQYGKDIARTLPRGITSAEGTLDADTMALAFDYRDGFAVVQALQAAPKEKAEVNRIVRERMAQEFPDPMERSDVMREEAQKAAHRSETDDVLLEELKTLSKTAGIRPPNVQAVKAVARQMLGKEQVKHIRPIVYQNAEAKAARLAGEAWKKGDAAKAAFHKRQQLLNHILYREAVKRIERSEVIRRFFKRMMTTPAQERLGKAGAAYQDGINALLESYGFGRVSLKELNKVQALNDYEATALDEALVVASVPASVTKQVAQINYRELTSDQLDDVYNMAQQIYQTAAKKDKALREEEKRTIDQMETDVIAQIEKNHTLSPRNIDTYPISLQGAKDMVAAVDAWHLAPEFLFTWLDGDTTGVTYRVFFEPIAQAEAEEFRRGEAAFAEMKKIEAMIELPSLVNDRSQKYDGIRTLMTKRAIIAVALNMGTQSGVEATLAARVDGVEQFGSYAAIQRMFAKALTEADWKYIQAKWDYANSFWPDIAELERETNGIVPRKLDAQQFTVETSDGKTILVNGGYYPLKYSGKLGIGDALKDYGKGLLTDEESIGAAGGARAQTQHGWTEERAKASGRPIDLSLNVWNAHIVNVIHDLTHRKAVRDVYRVYQRKGVRQAIEQSAGQELYNSLKPWLARVANPNQTLDNSFLENFTARARTGVTAVNMGLSVSVAMVQPLGYLQSADVIGANWMAKGIVAAYSPSWRSVAGAALGAAAYGSTLGPVGTVGGGLMGAFIGGLKKQTDFVLSQSVAMRQRREDYNRDMRDYVNARKGKMSNFEQYYFAFIGMMDNAVMVPTWIGGYRKAFAENGGNHDAAVQFADSAVRRSQGAGSPKDLSRVQGGPEFRRILTIHYSFLSRQYGLMRRSATNVKEGRWTKARVLASMSALVVLSPILAELAAGRPPEDDEDWLTWAIVQTLRGAAGAVVGLRDLARALGPDAFPYKISPVEDVFKKSVGALQTLGESVFEEDFELSESELKEIVETVGYWGRLPTRAVWRAVNEWARWMEGYDVEPADFIRTRPR